MISGYHEKIQAHYEKFPYPAYPLFAQGRWEDLKTVDVRTWGLDHPADDIWVAGCGTMGAFMFGRRNPQARVIGSDFSLSALQRCQTRLNLFGVRNVFLKCEDIFEVNYQGCFDAVDAYGVIHHTISPAKTLQNLTVSLKPKGILRLMVYSREGRKQIESLRAEIQQKDFKSVGEVKHFLGERLKGQTGDLAHSAGIADALLNPLVHVYDRKNLEELLAAQPDLEVLRIQDDANYVAFCRKR